MRSLWDNFEQYFCALLMVMLVMCLGAQVFFRYVLDASLTWTEELSRFCFIGTIYLGASLAAKDGHHVRVSAQYLLLPLRLRPYLRMVADAVWMVFNLVFAWQGIVLVEHALAFPETTPSLGWNAAYIYMVIPAGFVLMTLRTIQLYARLFHDGTWREVLAQAGGGES